MCVCLQPGIIAIFRPRRNRGRTSRSGDCASVAHGAFRAARAARRMIPRTADLCPRQAFPTPSAAAPAATSAGATWTCARTRRTWAPIASTGPRPARATTPSPWCTGCPDRRAGGRATSAALASKYRVLIPDLIGFGRSRVGLGLLPDVSGVAHVLGEWLSFAAQGPALPGGALHGRAGGHPPGGARAGAHQAAGAGGRGRPAAPPHAAPRHALCVRGAAAAAVGRSHLPPRDPGRCVLRGAVDGDAGPAQHPSRRRAAAAGGPARAHAAAVGRTRHHHPAFPRRADAAPDSRLAAAGAARRLPQPHGGLRRTSSTSPSWPGSRGTRWASDARPHAVRSVLPPLPAQLAGGGGRGMGDARDGTRRTPGRHGRAVGRHAPHRRPADGTCATARPARGRRWCWCTGWGAPRTTGCATARGSPRRDTACWRRISPASGGRRARGRD